MARKKKVEETLNVEVTCVVSYFDKELKKMVLAGDTLTVDPARAAILKDKGFVR